MKTIAIIPAKGASKRVPGKNLLPMLGKPLIAWTIEAAKKSSRIDRVIVSTDDDEVARIAREHGAEVPYLQPPDVSEGNVEKCMAYALNWLDKNEGYAPDALVLLLTTNPLRQPEQLDACIDLYEKSGADCVASVCGAEATHNPHWMFMRDKDGKVTTCMAQELKDMPLFSQQLPSCYIRNDACFVIRPDNLRKPTPSMWGTHVELYPIDQRFDTDINTPEDWHTTEDKLRRLLASEQRPTP